MAGLKRYAVSPWGDSVIVHKEPDGIWSSHADVIALLKRVVVLLEFYGQIRGHRSGVLEILVADIHDTIGHED